MELYASDVAKWLMANERDIIAAADSTEREAVSRELRLNLEALPVYALKLIGQGELTLAQDAFNTAGKMVYKYLNTYSLIYVYIDALLQMKGGQLALAEKSLRIYLGNDVRSATDEVGYFYLGNVCYLQGKVDEAMQAYARAISYKRRFREALANRQAALLGERLPHADVHLDLETCALESWRELPIFINSRDRLDSLRALVDWLVAAGHTRIIILDNASTYPPLLDYYRSLDSSDVTNVVYLHHNIGHTAIWDSGVLERLDIRTPYVYTDSDVVPDENCPRDLVRHLLLGLKRYPWLDKCGVALRVDDIVLTDSATKWQCQFSRLLLDDDFFFAPTDTTFALYNNYRHYTLNMSARTRRLQARHIPWYYAPDNIPADEAYYRDHANASSTCARAARGESVFPNGEPEWTGFF